MGDRRHPLSFATGRVTVTRAQAGVVPRSRGGIVRALRLPLPLPPEIAIPRRRRDLDWGWICEPGAEIDSTPHLEAERYVRRHSEDPRGCRTNGGSYIYDLEEG